MQGWIRNALAGLCAGLLSPLALSAQISIIPEPVAITDLHTEFSLPETMTVALPAGDPDTRAVVTDFSESWKQLTGRELTPTTGKILRTPAISIEIKNDPALRGVEGYRLHIAPEGIHITAVSAVGVFYAFESLQQVIPAGASQLKTLKIPCADILDYPRFGMRGMHLDVSRHFFTVAFVKKYIDLLARYKLNMFHWHLTDSHGWRIEIKKYPRLTSVGAWRADRSGIPGTIAPPTAAGEPATYGGFYTQEEIKSVIEYAKKRFVSIIPEIEIPGHCTAALVAYPAYSDLDNPNPLLIPCGYPGDLVHNLCLGYEPSFTFVEDILTEVMALFPSPFVHIGGDEVRGGPWLACSRCKKRMQEKGFTKAKEYQDWFTHRIDSFISAHGKRMIGWDEVLHADIGPTAAAVAWHDNDAAVHALKKGHDILMAPYHYTYFDFYQSDPRLEPDITYAGLPLDTVYAFEPVPAGLTPAESRHILGGEACLWTENFSTPAAVEYMLLPRLMALAEVLWSPPSKKNYAAFIKKIEKEFPKLAADHTAYATSMYNVSIQPWYDSVRKAIEVSLYDQTHLYPIHYSLDGSAPNNSGPLYTKPLLITASADLHTAVFRNDSLIGTANADQFTIHKALGAQLSVTPDSATEKNRLLDGIGGTVEPYDGRWVFFHDSVLTVTIDLGKTTTVHACRMGMMEDQVGDIYFPQSVEMLSSQDGIHFESFYQHRNDKIPEQLIRHTTTYGSGSLSVTARFVRLRLVNGHHAAEPIKNQFLIDEIVVQ